MARYASIVQGVQLIFQSHASCECSYGGIWPRGGLGALQRMRIIAEGPLNMLDIISDLRGQKLQSLDVGEK